MIDVIIIGAGPAGLSAAIVTAEFGLKVKVIDEFIKPGGRLLGQLFEEQDGTWWNGIHESQKLTMQAMNLGVQIHCGISVHHLEKKKDLWHVYTNQSYLTARHVLIATGSAESSIPLPGWTLPGVMSVGAAQVMTNVHRVKAGNKGIIIGINALSTAIARELQLAGIEVVSMVLPPKHQLSGEMGKPDTVFDSLLRVSHLAPSSFLRTGSRLLKNSGYFKKLGVQFYPKQGMKLWDIPIHLRRAANRIIGGDEVEEVELVDITVDGKPIKGSEQIVKADFVCIAGNLYPLAELAAVAGCPFYHIPELGGYVPLHNEKMETLLPGLYVAGSITGIEGAKVAIAQGTVAGLSILHHLNPDNREIENRLSESLTNVKRVREKAPFQFHPSIQEGREKMAILWDDFKNKRTVSHPS